MSSLAGNKLGFAYLQCVQVLPDMYSAGQAPLSYEQDMCMPPSAHRMLQRGYAQMPGHIMNVHPYFTECLDAHQIVVSTHCNEIHLLVLFSPVHCWLCKARPPMEVIRPPRLQNESSVCHQRHHASHEHQYL